MISIRTSFPDQFTSRFDVPRVVMETALTPYDNSQSMKIIWKQTRGNVLPTDINYIFVHIAEVHKQSQLNQIREFDVRVNNENMVYTTVTEYLNDSSYVAWVGSPGWINISMIRTLWSTLPPLINAVESYVIRGFFELETQQLDGKLICFRDIVLFRNNFGV